MFHPEIIIIFFFIALIYSSVGFGGGSSYLAVLALYEFPFKEMRLIALICNIIVVTGGTIAFIRHGQLVWKKTLPLIIASIPLAFLGASVRISADLFFEILGVTLIIAAMLLWIKTLPVQTDTEIKKNYLKNGVLGGGIGFLSGLVGIGGGIFLSPLLNPDKWGSPKQIAATASIFILVNSLSRIAGQMTNAGEINRL